MATPPDFSPGQVLTAADMDAVGLWLVKVVDFSGAATATVDNAFTSDFENYRVLISNFTVTAGSPNWQIRMRAAGTNAAGANYFGGYNYTTYAGVTAGYGDNAATGFNLAFVSSTGVATSYDINFMRPNIAATTNIHFQGLAPDSQRAGSGVHSVATAYDGFQIIAASGNIAGRIRVYGFRN